MAENARELVTAAEEKLSGFRIELPDTPKNRERVLSAFHKLEEMILAGYKISFGLGTPKDKGTIVLEAEDLTETAARHMRRLFGEKKPVQLSNKR